MCTCLPVCIIICFCVDTICFYNRNFLCGTTSSATSAPSKSVHLSQKDACWSLWILGRIQSHRLALILWFECSTRYDSRPHQRVTVREVRAFLCTHGRTWKLVSRICGLPSCHKSGTAAFLGAYLREGSSATLAVCLCFLLA